MTQKEIQEESRDKSAFSLALAQKVLIACIAFLTFVTSYCMVTYTSGKSKSPAQSDQLAQSQPQNTPQAQAEPNIPAETPEPNATVQPALPIADAQPQIPLSIRLAEQLFEEELFPAAEDVYRKLKLAAPENRQGELVTDFLNFRIALCVEKQGDLEQASVLLGHAAISRSPILRVMATCSLSTIQTQRRQFLQARENAYKALALLPLVGFDRQWAIDTERKCRFLTAMSLTTYVLSLKNADHNIPPEMLTCEQFSDPLVALEPDKLAIMLEYGCEQLDAALLAPKVELLDGSNPVRSSVICNSASIEELLSRLVSKTTADVNWIADDENASTISASLRNRAVTLYTSAATTEQIAEIAAGAVGLLCEPDDQNDLRIFDPYRYESLSKNVSALTDHAISIWQTYTLKYYQDDRLSASHFALALLYKQQGNPDDAIAACKLVANSSTKSSYAPHALLLSSELKAELQNYAGAKNDLLELVEQYSDSPLCGKAALSLAITAEKAESYEDAQHYYRKMYNIENSKDTQAHAALGAARCFYQLGQYENAEKWVGIHLQIIGQQDIQKLHEAYYLLGKIHTAIGNSEKAWIAFQKTLLYPSSSQDYVQTITSLIEALLEENQCLRALSALDNIETWNFTEQQATQLLILKSKTLAQMGLPQSAASQLQNSISYTTDPQLKNIIAFEMAKCQIKSGQLENARKTLTNILTDAEPGDFCHRVALELAQVCFSLEEYDHSFSVCKQLLQMNANEKIKKAAKDVLLRTFEKRNEYDNAAKLLIGEDIDNKKENLEPEEQNTTAKLVER